MSYIDVLFSLSICYLGTRYIHDNYSVPIHCIVYRVLLACHNILTLLTPGVHTDTRYAPQ